MSDSLEDFLSNKKDRKTMDAFGSFTCQECNEVVNEGYIDEEDMILFYTCSSNHESRARL